MAEGRRPSTADHELSNGHVRGAAPLRVGVNLLWLVPGEVGGTEEYALALLRALALADGIELVVFCQPTLRQAHPGLAEVATLVPSPGNERRRSVRLLWENSWLPYHVHRHRLDVVHHLGGTVPLVDGVGSVLTLYDLQPLTHPERFTPVKRTWLRAVLPRSVRRAGAVLTLSEHVRQRVIDHLPVPADRVVVAPPGPLHTRGAGSTGRRSGDELRRRHRLPGPVLLYPAISHPHKNHHVLVRALPRLLANHSDARLVLTGRPGLQDAALEALARQLRVDHAVRRLGRVAPEELRALYDDAAALVFPSIHEGFGLPLLEAMSHACPIVAADASAIPEIVGHHGLLLPPHDPVAWADALNALLSDRPQQVRMAAAALHGATRFSWDRVIPEIVSVYRSLVSASRSPAPRWVSRAARRSRSRRHGAVPGASRPRLGPRPPPRLPARPRPCRRTGYGPTLRPRPRRPGAGTTPGTTHPAPGPTP